MSPKVKKIIIAVTISVLFIAGLKLFSSFSSYDVTARGARDTKRIEDFQNFKMALMLYHAERNVYPKRLTDLMPRYLSEIPLDPREGELHRNPACELAIGENTFSYRYGLTESGGKFTLAACLEEGKILTISSNENE